VYVPKRTDKRQQRPDKGKDSSRKSRPSLGLILTALGLIVALYVAELELRPKPTMSLESPLDPDDALSTPFVLSNDGLLSLEDVKVAVIMKGFEDSRHNTVSIGATDWSVLPMSHELKPGDKKTIPAPFNRLIKTSDPVIAGEFAVVISFKPECVPFWQTYRGFRFAVARQSDGRSRFQQQPAEGVEEEYRRATSR
jgi:hypothetical protein